MRVLVSVVPGLGHFHPMVPLCRALVAAGHEVRVAVPPRFAPLVERTGLQSVPVRPDWLESDADAAFPGFTNAGSAGQIDVFAQVAALGLVDDLVRVGGAWGADVVLHDHTELGGWLAAELLELPNVPYAMTARILDPQMLGVLIPERVGALLTHFGLPPDPALVRPSRWLYLDSIPPSFAAAFSQPGPTVRPVRYSTEDRSGDERLPGWLLEPRRRPLVYITLGTVFNRTDGLMRTLIDAASALEVDVVVTTGRNLDPGDLGPLPDRVRAHRYIPQRDLLPLCDAVLCHGGFNTVFGALSVGTPVVLVPLSADQPLNAYLVEAGGLGESCTTELPAGHLFPVARPSDVSAEQVRRALERVLRDDGYRAAAARIQTEMNAQPAVEHGVALIEQLVASA